MDIPQSAAELVRRSRGRAGISQRRLAIRAGCSQGAISRIERGLEEPTLARLRRLLACLGEELVVTSRPLEHPFDPVHLDASLRLTHAERAAQAIGANEFADEVRRGGRELRDPASS